MLHEKDAQTAWICGCPKGKPVTRSLSQNRQKASSMLLVISNACLRQPVHIRFAVSLLE